MDVTAPATRAALIISRASCKAHNTKHVQRGRLPPGAQPANCTPFVHYSTEGKVGPTMQP